MTIEHPYLLFLGSAQDRFEAKTAWGIAEWRPGWCLGQLRLEGARVDLGLPDMTVTEAAEAGAKTLIIGVANRGGKILPLWQETMIRALEHGMDIASGLHHKLADLPAVAEVAKLERRRLFDVRHPQQGFEVGSAEPRSGRRLLTVGTDCSVGKMYTTLALEKEMTARGMKADFRATGQTGILIAGEGVAVDAVVADFISGATEWLCPANDPDHWDLVEGQASLFHPSFAGVSLGLLHGAQAEALVLCHEPGREHMRGLPHFPLPDVGECIALTEQCARLTNPKARVVGLSLMTPALTDTAAAEAMAELADRHALPVVDSIRTGVGPLIDALG